MRRSGRPEAAYLLEPGALQPKIQLSIPVKLLTGALVLVMVVAGIFPHYLMELTGAAAAILIKTL